MAKEKTDNDKNNIMVSEPSIQITKVIIDNKDVVTIEADERVIVAPMGDEENSQERTNFHSVTSSFPPHEDFIKAFRLGLRRFAMSMAEFNKKDIPLVNQMTVGEMRIAGEQEKKNSRVEFVLMKWIKRTGKGVPIRTGQAVMYGQDGQEIPETQQMTEAIDLVIAEALKYMDGKNGHNLQLRFPFQMKKTA
jgi:hypothetical protein